MIQSINLNMKWNKNIKREEKWRWYMIVTTPIDTRVLFDRDRLFVIQKKDHIFEINVFKMLQKISFYLEWLRKILVLFEIIWNKHTWLEVSLKKCKIFIKKRIRPKISSGFSKNHHNLLLLLFFLSHYLTRKSSK